MSQARHIPTWTRRLLLLAFVGVLSSCARPADSLAATAGTRIALPLIRTSDVIWSADNETGDLSQWDDVWISAPADARISTAHAHSGRYSVALTVYGANGNGPSPGARLVKIRTRRTGETLPDDAYYSVWYYFPSVVRPAVWWNIFQWKRKWVRDSVASSDPVYTVNVGNRPNGAMYLYLYNHVGGDGRYNTEGAGRKAEATIDLPLDRWARLECRYRWNYGHGGLVRCWQDGRLIWDVRNVITEYDDGVVSNPRQWTVNSYTDQTNPPTHTIYIDDAAIRYVHSDDSP